MTEGDPAAAVEVVRQALSRTLAARTAKITYSMDFELKLPKFPEPQHRSTARRLAGQAAKTVGKAIGKGICRLATRRRHPGHQTAEGFIDFTGRRFMIDHGGYATTRIGDQQWSGRSGRALHTLPGESPRVGSPLWLMDLLGGTAGAEDRDTDRADPQQWKQYAVTASAADAATKAPGQVPTPAQDHFENLLALPLEVWIDADGLVRRIRAVQENQTTAVTLQDFGINIDELDWTQLPTFRTPQK